MLGINETKLGEDFPDHLVSIDVFEIDHDKLGGGVALYICDSVNFKVADFLPANSLELLRIEILPKVAHPFSVVSFYPPPSSKVGKFEELQDVLSYLESSGRETILLGDTNCDILETADPSGPFSSQSRHMTNMYDNFGFKQLASEPTRETVSTKTLIDQITTTHPNNIVDSGVVQLATSDHYLIYCVRKFMGNLSKVPKVFESRQMKNFDKKKFTADLSRFYWDD